VKRLSKILLIAATVPAGGVVAAIVGLNLYVQSPARRRDSGAAQPGPRNPLKSPMSRWGWSGVQIAGVRIPSEGRNLLEASSFSAEYRLIPLFHRQLAIRKMVLDSPKVIWAQNAEGKWVLPALPDKGRKENAALQMPPARRRNRPRHPARAASRCSWIALRSITAPSNCWTRSKIASPWPPTWRCATRSIPRVRWKGPSRPSASIWQDALTRSMK